MADGVTCSAFLDEADLLVDADGGRVRVRDPEQDAVQPHDEPDEPSVREGLDAKNELLVGVAVAIAVACRELVQGDRMAGRHPSWGKVVQDLT
jgi:hypothetical protein